MPEDATVLERNLAGLAALDPALASAVRAAPPDPRVACVPARNGVLVPTVRSGGGIAPLHSLYDPRAEARRLAHSSTGDGFVVVLGLGGGFQVEALLQEGHTAGVVVIEKDAGVLRSLFSLLPYGNVLDDPRVSLAVGLPQIRPAILRGWTPALMGGMRMLTLRSWFDLERAYFDAAAAEVQAGIDAVRADYSVQSHFGKRWFTNMLANLPRVTGGPPASRRDPVTRSAAVITAAVATAAVVTAAGPSLEEHLPGLAAQPRTGLIVATDTSLPALLHSGVQPDCVLSIDCQAYGYHHFFQGLPKGTTLYLDLASPPLLARRFPGARFVAGGHPFARYVDAHWMRLPMVDTSGGNVAHAAVTLAHGLGATRIEVHGADFGYPAAKPYCRGTYLYELFQAAQGRLTPADSELTRFALRGADPEKRGNLTVYTTPLMAAYRRRFTELIRTIHSQPRDWPPQTVPTTGWRAFLSEYAGRVQSAPAAGLIARTDEIWGTILPAAARVIKDGSAPGPAALEEARSWSLGRILRVLGASDPGANDPGTNDPGPEREP